MGNQKHHIVSYSGGICSFWAAHRVLAKNRHENTTLLFADTLMEDEDLYRFNENAERVLGKEITVIADGRTPWGLFEDEGFLGNSRVDLCSRVLKRDLLWKWIKDRFKPEDCVVYLGLDWTEEHRLKRTRDRMPGWSIQAPMQDEPVWDKCRMQEELRSVGLEAPRLYKLGFPHNNCGGFCVKAGQAHFAHLLKTLPERFREHESKEQGIRERLGKNVSILKDRRGGTPKPMTLADLRARIESGDSFDRGDWGGCGCAIDWETEGRLS